MRSETERRNNCYLVESFVNKVVNFVSYMKENGFHYWKWT